MRDKILASFSRPEELLHINEGIDRQTFLQVQMLKFKNNLENFE